MEHASEVVEVVDQKLVWRTALHLLIGAPALVWVFVLAQNWTIEEVGSLRCSWREKQVFGWMEARHVAVAVAAAACRSSSADVADVDDVADAAFDEGASFVEVSVPRSASDSGPAFRRDFPSLSTVAPYPYPFLGFP
jgi:hypothetical protein